MLNFCTWMSSYRKKSFLSDQQPSLFRMQMLLEWIWWDVKLCPPKIFVQIRLRRTWDRLAIINCLRRWPLRDLVSYVHSKTYENVWRSSFYLRRLWEKMIVPKLLLWVMRLRPRNCEKLRHNRFTRGSHKLTCSDGCFDQKQCSRNEIKAKGTG